MGKVGKAKSEVPETPAYQGTTDPKLAWRQQLFMIGCLIIVLLVDVGCTIGLYAALHLGAVPAPHHRTWGDVWRSLFLFHTDSVDLILLSLVRVAVVSLLAHTASRFAWNEGHALEFEPALHVALRPKPSKAGPKHAPADSSSSPKLSLPFYKRATSSSEESSSELKQALIPKEREETGTSGSSSAGAGAGAGGAGGGGGASPSKREGAATDLGFREWVSNVSKKDVALFASFLTCTVFQVYIGAKCVSFDFGNELVQGLLMGSTVVWINSESVIVSSLAEASGVLGRATGQAARRRHAEEAAAAAAGARVSASGHTPNGLPLPNGGSSSADPRRLREVTTAAHGASKPAGLMDEAAAMAAIREGRLRGDRGVRDEKAVSPRVYLMRAIALAKQEMTVISVGFLCLAITSAAGLILPNYQGRILDDVIKMNAALFKQDVFFMAMYSLVTGIFGGIRGLCFSVVGKRVLKTLQDKLFNGVIIQDIAYFDATTSGELTSRLTNDVSAMAEPLNWQLSTLVRNVASLTGGVILSFFTSWKLSMLAFTTMAPIMHITAVYSRWSRELNRKRYAVLAEANSAASEALGNIRTVRAFSTEDVEMDRYKSKTMAAMTKGVRDAFAYSGAVAINNWLDLGASVLILWYGGVLVMEGRLSIGKLITFQLYWNLIQSGYQSIMSVLMSLTRASGAAQRVLSLIDALPDIDPNFGTKVSTLRGGIDLKDVHFHYQMRPEHQVLTGVTLSVGPGQVCALVGRSGGGKSTIVHLLMRFYDPIRGQILLDGIDLRDLNLKSVHQHMGVVAQDTQMWACSIEENITYGLSSYTPEEVVEAAKNANAHDFIQRFPSGYATRVGERGVRLSGGQRQRIAIARMLLRRPRVLLLDEATSALDTESEALVQAALDRLIAEGGRTIVLVAHRLSTVRNADLIGVMEKGKVVEQGTHNDLVKIPGGVYERLVRRQLTKAANTLDETEVDKSDNIDVLLDDTKH